MKAMIKRNLLLFFRDKSAVLFSLMAAFIVLGLYIVFLKSTIVSAFSEIDEVEFLIDSWMVGGLFSVVSVTTTLGALGTMVEDRTNKIIKDFYVSPIPGWKIVASYIASAVIIGISMGFITFVVSEIYIIVKGGELLPIIAMAKMIGMIMLTVLASCAILFFLVSFFSSSRAFSTASTIIGTLIGFLTGIYIPIGQFPDAVQTIIKVFPISHGASVMRQIMMEVPLKTAFSGVPAEYLKDFKEMLGVTFSFGSYEMEPIVNIMILLCVALIFFLLSVISVAKEAK